MLIESGIQCIDRTFDTAGAIWQVRPGVQIHSNTSGCWCCAGVTTNHNQCQSPSAIVRKKISWRESQEYFSEDIQVRDLPVTCFGCLIKLSWLQVAPDAPLPGSDAPPLTSASKTGDAVTQGFTAGAVLGNELFVFNKKNPASFKLQNGSPKLGCDCKENEFFKTPFLVTQSHKSSFLCC